MHLLELVGLPGAGKSTIYEQLLARDPGIATMPILRHPPYRQVLARELATTLATLARRRALGRQWSRELVVMMAYLRALPRVLDGPHGPRTDALVFDQGPLYTLCRPALRDPRLTGWRDETLALWRDRLHTVAWLDAPDAVLAQRIDTRGKEHRLKHGGPAVAAALQQDREVYEAALARLDGGPRVLRLDTGRTTPDAIVDDLLAMIRPS